MWGGGGKASDLTLVVVVGDGRVFDLRLVGWVCMCVCVCVGGGGKVSGLSLMGEVLVGVVEVGGG